MQSGFILVSSLSINVNRLLTQFIDTCTGNIDYCIKGMMQDILQNFKSIEMKDQPAKMMHGIFPSEFR